MDWPEKARYHVHIFESRGPDAPAEVARVFRRTLRTDDGGPPLRKSGAKGWWERDEGFWWAKAHARNFDCEAKWQP